MNDKVKWEILVIAAPSYFPIVPWTCLISTEEKNYVFSTELVFCKKICLSMPRDPLPTFLHLQDGMVFMFWL